MTPEQLALAIGVAYLLVGVGGILTFEVLRYAGERVNGVLESTI